MSSLSRSLKCILFALFILLAISDTLARSGNKLPFPMVICDSGNPSLSPSLCEFMVHLIAEPICADGEPNCKPQQFFEVFELKKRSDENEDA